MNVTDTAMVNGVVNVSNEQSNLEGQRPFMS